MLNNMINPGLKPGAIETRQKHAASVPTGRGDIREN